VSELAAIATDTGAVSIAAMIEAETSLTLVPPLVVLTMAFSLSYWQDPVVPIKG